MSTVRFEGKLNGNPVWLEWADGRMTGDMSLVAQVHSEAGEPVHGPDYDAMLNVGEVATVAAYLAEHLDNGVERQLLVEGPEPEPVE